MHVNARLYISVVACIEIDVESVGFGRDIDFIYSTKPLFGPKIQMDIALIFWTLINDQEPQPRRTSQNRE